MGTTEGTVNDYLKKLRKKYGAKNTRHLVYLRYARQEDNQKGLKASERGIQVLQALVMGKTQKEIGKILGITDRCVEWHIEKMIEDNFIQDADELVVLFADWQKSHPTQKEDLVK